MRCGCEMVLMDDDVKYDIRSRALWSSRASVGGESCAGVGLRLE